VGRHRRYGAGRQFRGDADSAGRGARSAAGVVVNRVLGHAGMAADGPVDGTKDKNGDRPGESRRAVLILLGLVVPPLVPVVAAGLTGNPWLFLGELLALWLLVVGVLAVRAYRRRTLAAYLRFLAVLAVGAGLVLPSAITGSLAPFGITVTAAFLTLAVIAVVRSASEALDHRPGNEP
jgi:hypothetical protein